MSTFADHFSGHAQQYAQARPYYPPALFEWIASQCNRRSLAWEAGCGNGQATAAIAAHFERVVATDPSAAQIAAAAHLDRVEYRVETAESPSLAPASCDLVFAAQAYHWFDQPRFHTAVRRTLRPDGLVVVVTYGLLRVDDAVDPVIDELYRRTLASDWPAERTHVDEAYRRLPFPYLRLDAPGFVMRHDWSLVELMAYLSTWSAVQRHRNRSGVDPLVMVGTRLADAWPGASRRAMHWPLTVLAGRFPE